jgi:hypothetical protein
MDALFQASWVFVYAVVGLAVALFRVARILVCAVVGGIVAYCFEREGERMEGTGEPESVNQSR